MRPICSCLFVVLVALGPCLRCLVSACDESNLYQSPNLGTCLPRKQIGSYCNIVQVCELGATCSSNTCVPNLGPRTKMLDGQCVPDTTSQGLLVRSELREPRVIQSQTNEVIVDLVLDMHPYSDSVYDCPRGMRMYNADVPGPTIMVKPGDTLIVNLFNTLGPDEPGLTNTVREINSTNLHTHGLHISAKHPQDNVVFTIDPGDNYTYVYEIPEHHMPGHSWYHPHHHGATSLQSVAAFGNIYVQNVGDYGFVLPFPNPLQQLQTIFAAVGAPALNRNFFGMSLNNILEKLAPDQMCHKQTSDVIADNYLMVNFQLEPYVRLSRQQPLQINFLNHDWSSSLNLTVVNAEGQPDCTMHLMEKDGIALPDAPRTISFAPMNPAARASIIFLCEDAGHANVVNNQGGNTIVVMTLRVNHHVRGQDGPHALTSAKLEALAPLPVKWPSYVEDLASKTPSVFNSLKYEVMFDGRKPSNLMETSPWLTDEPAFFTINDRLWNLERPMFDVPYAAVVETKLINSFKDNLAHPHHQHIVPFQIQTLPAGSSALYGNYLRTGDWHDTLAVADPVLLNPPENVTGLKSEWTMRWRIMLPDQRMVFHCHFLDHEDQGMMSWFRISHLDGSYVGHYSTDDNVTEQPAYFP